MKKTKILFLGMLGMLTLSSCLDTHDDPDTSKYLLTSATSVGEVNATLAKVKDTYCSGPLNDLDGTSGTNFYARVDSDVVFEGVVCANDLTSNIYQMVLLRDIDAAAGTDQCIQLGIKSTALYSYFPLGQRVRVNLKGLYVGVYSKVPKVGQPYKTSAGNWRLGPILLDLCKTNVQLIGTPDASAPELTPIDFSGTDGAARLSQTEQKYWNTPMLATLEGTIKEAQPGQIDTPAYGTFETYSGVAEPMPKTFGPQELHDDGYGIDRTIQLLNGKTASIRTSTRNAVSFLPLPTNSRKYTGMVTFYNEWQVQVRTPEDIYPAITADDENTTLAAWNKKAEAAE